MSIKINVHIYIKNPFSLGNRETRKPDCSYIIKISCTGRFPCAESVSSIVVNVCNELRGFNVLLKSKLISEEVSNEQKAYDCTQKRYFIYEQGSRHADLGSLTWPHAIFPTSTANAVHFIASGLKILEHFIFTCRVIFVYF